MASTFILPFGGLSYVPSITQGYGPSTLLNADGSYVEPPGHGHAAWHNGLDFGSDGSNPGVPTGTTIVAAGAGNVLYAGDADGSAAALYFHDFGTIVVIDHNDGLWTLYAHLLSVYVTAGQGVQQGQPIALSDSTGRSFAPHLHFSVFAGNSQADVDPTRYLSGVVAPTPGQSSGVLTYEQVIYLARQVGIPEDQLATCAAIAMAESGLRVSAQNPSGAAGLWQILPSQHKEYDVPTLLSDPQYNATAMAAISSNGRDWTPWESYTSDHNRHYLGPGKGFYRDYLGDAQTALAGFPPGSVAPSSSPGTTAPGVVDPGYYDATPLDTSPQLPVLAVKIVAVAVGASDLVTRPNAQATAVLWIGGNVYELPVIDLSVTRPTYLQPGRWSATIGLEQLDRYPGLWDELEVRGHTQVIAYMGYVPDKRRPFTIDQLEPMFTGLLVTPHIGHKDRQVTLGGPDLSGIYSADSATLSSLPDSWVNAYVSKVVQAIVARHNVKGGGLSAVVDESTVWAGQAAGSDMTSTRQTGQTEWNWLQQMASTLGYACYMDGTALHFQRWPADQTPLVLDYAVDGEPASLVQDVQIDYMSHAKRDYEIITQAWQTTTAKIQQSDPQGNHDVTSPTVITLPANTPKKTLDARAKAIYQLYQATEVKVTIPIAGVVRLGANQPIALRSDRINGRFLTDAATGAPRLFYPSEVTYTYAARTGLAMSVVATNRPTGIVQQNTDTSLLG